METFRELLRMNGWKEKVDLQKMSTSQSQYTSITNYTWVKSTISSRACYLAHPMPMGFHQGDATNSNLPLQYGVHMIVYIDDGRLPNQVKNHLEALFVLMSIINIPNSVTTLTQKTEFLGLLVDSTSLHLCLQERSPSTSGCKTHRVVPVS